VKSLARLKKGGSILSIAPNQKQAKISLDYAEAIFQHSPMMRQLLANHTADTLELSNDISVEVRPASFRIRGPTYVAAICDEAAFWLAENSGSVNPDIEIINAARPGLATTRGPLIIASSPYARRGVLWDVYRRHYGHDGDLCVPKTQTRT
jgi:hypothetical protein